jgi:hypothetical protein
MDERRKFIRFPIELVARYSENDAKDWKECSVIDISREGMGINIYAGEYISEGLILQMEITLPVQDDPIAVTGTLMWITELKDDTRFNYLGGVKLLAIKPEDKWTLIDYAYEGWEKGGK